MKLEEMQYLTNILLEERQNVLNSAAFNKNINLVDDDGDHVDKIQGTVLSDIHERLSSRNSAKLHSLNNALQKMKDNCYGVCEDCDEDIPYKRLLFNPCIVTCVYCAENREQKLK